jgi:hypothetical protein
VNIEGPFGIPSSEIFSELDETKAKVPIFFDTFIESEGEMK